MPSETSSRPGEAFPSTRWSQVLAGGERDSGQALRFLAEVYWRPVYAYLRARWAKRDDEALDATQEFFLWVQESGFLGRADPGRGRFRGFLRTALQHFMIDRQRRQRALRRGGARAVVPLPGDGALDLPDPGTATPEAALDEAWRAELLRRGLDRLEQELRAEGRATCYEVFRDYFLQETEERYEDVARRHGLSKVDVSNHLILARRRFRVHLKAVVMETVQGPEELAEELEWLFGPERT